MTEHWRLFNTLQEQPLSFQNTFLTDCMKKLHSHGTPLNIFADNDPIGLLWHLGILLYPSHLSLDEVHESALKIAYEFSQKLFSVAILEEEETILIEATSKAKNILVSRLKFLQSHIGNGGYRTAGGFYNF
jgi:hypothetical protein